MRSRQPAVFLVTILVLAGASAFRTLALAIAPPVVGTSMMRVFMLIASAAFACAVAGSLRALSTNRR